MTYGTTHGKTSMDGDHLARAIKLSYCYLTFYIVQILMAATLCSLLFFDYHELVVFVEIPIAFFIMLDIILSHYVEARKNLCSKIQTVNMLVLVGSMATIFLDFAIPHITQNRIHTVFNVIRTLRYVIQVVWIVKLGYESKKLFNTYNNDMIQIQPFNQMQEQMNKMTL